MGPPFPSSRGSVWRLFALLGLKPVMGHAGFSVEMEAGL